MGYFENPARGGLVLWWTQGLYGTRQQGAARCSKLPEGTGASRTPGHVGYFRYSAIAAQVYPPRIGIFARWAVRAVAARLSCRTPDSDGFAHQGQNKKVFLFTNILNIFCGTGCLKKNCERGSGCVYNLLPFCPRRARSKSFVNLVSAGIL